MAERGLKVLSKHQIAFRGRRFTSPLQGTGTTGECASGTFSPGLQRGAQEWEIVEDARMAENLPASFTSMYLQLQNKTDLLFYFTYCLRQKKSSYVILTTLKSLHECLRNS